LQEENMRNKYIATFVKDNSKTFSRLNDSLLQGDFKTAHRIAHTLKSSAGYLGKTLLQEAAASLEASLQNEPPAYEPAQIELIKNELQLAISEFENILRQAKKEAQAVKELSAEEISNLLSELKPLLENSDFAAADYVEKLQSIPGMEVLAERIDEYDFDAALKILEEALPNG
jgi:HPt (histidine-containing phosphotransfer) domain-containing protein